MDLDKKFKDKFVKILNEEIDEYEDDRDDVWHDLGYDPIVVKPTMNLNPEDPHIEEYKKRHEERIKEKAAKKAEEKAYEIKHKSELISYQLKKEEEILNKFIKDGKVSDVNNNIEDNWETVVYRVKLQYLHKAEKSAVKQFKVYTAYKVIFNELHIQGFDRQSSEVFELIRECKESNVDMMERALHDVFER